MKLIISESKLKNLVDRVVGYDLSNHIEIITSYYNLDYSGRFIFSDGKEEFNWLQNHYGPMFRFFDIDGRNFLTQKQGSEWWIVEEGVGSIEYDEFLNLLGINMLGIGLGTIIDNFWIENED